MQFDDPAAHETFQKIAALLARAYLRYVKVQRLPEPTVNKELANRGEQRVHEGG